MGLFDFITNPIGGLVGGLAGGAFNFFGQQQTNQMQQQLQQQQEAYNTQMSNTAYTRAVADMKNAGLNPMMMFGSGGPSSTPQAPSIQMTSPLSSAGSSIQNAINSAMQLKTANATIDNLVEQNAKIKADAAVASAQLPKIAQDTDTSFATAQNIRARTKLTDIATASALAEASQADIQKGYSSSMVGKILGYLGLAGQDISKATSPIHQGASSATAVRRAWNPLDAY